MTQITGRGGGSWRGGKVGRGGGRDWAREGGRKRGEREREGGEGEGEGGGKGGGEGAGRYFMTIQQQGPTPAVKGLNYKNRCLMSTGTASRTAVSTCTGVSILGQEQI